MSYNLHKHLLPALPLLLRTPPNSNRPAEEFPRVFASINRAGGLADLTEGYVILGVDNIRADGGPDDQQDA